MLRQGRSGQGKHKADWDRQLPCGQGGMGAQSAGKGPWKPAPQGCR